MHRQTAAAPPVEVSRPLRLQPLPAPGAAALLRRVGVWTRGPNRHQHRGDFLVRLSDGRDARLHPRQRRNSDAHRVEGKWEHRVLNPPPDGGEIDPLGVLAPLQDQALRPGAEAPRGGGRGGVGPGGQHGSVCLTDSNAFNWRGYLANRPGMEALLRGAHVWQFAFVWTWDPNRRQHRGETSSPASPTAATYGCTLDSAARLTPSRASGSIGFSTRCRTEAKWTRRRGP